MAHIRPFLCIHPDAEYVSRTAALPYDVYNRQEAAAAAAKDPLSFLNIDRPETQFPADYDMYAPEVYEEGASMLREQIEKGIYVKDESACYYLYELTMNGRSQTGITACADIDDYVSEVIRKHENTRAEKEADRIRHITTLKAQTGPIFLAYRDEESLSALVASIKDTQEPCFDFVSDDGIRHRGWKVSKAEDIGAIEDAFLKMDRIYIADGHHRAASAVKVGLALREEKKNAGISTEDAESERFLCVLFPDSQLMIMPYNRYVHDLNGMSAQEFLAKMEERFIVTPSEHSVMPEEKGTFGMFLDHCWYKVRFKEEDFCDDPVEGLDVSLLQNLVLTPMLGIGDPRTDNRISFIGGIRGNEELEKLAETEGVSFSMYQTSIAELFAVADAGRLMPPKSTWFEPKLRSGLFIHDIG